MSGILNSMKRAAVAKACGVDESWFDGWSGEPIGIYPAGARDSGTYERVSAAAAARTWVLHVGPHTRPLTALEASRIRYALDRLCVKHFGRAPLTRSA